MADVLVSMQAYCKLVLHAAKYPHCSVNGVLLAEKSKNKESKTLKFVDAIPLFHLNVSLAPMMEVALTQVCLRPSTPMVLSPGGSFEPGDSIILDSLIPYQHSTQLII